MRVGADVDPVEITFPDVSCSIKLVNADEGLVLAAFLIEATLKLNFVPAGFGEVVNCKVTFNLFDDGDEQVVVLFTVLTAVHVGEVGRVISEGKST